jgi:hypothetical protein
MDIKERAIQCKRHFGNQGFPGCEQVLNRHLLGLKPIFLFFLRHG